MSNDAVDSQKYLYKYSILFYLEQLFKQLF